MLLFALLVPTAGSCEVAANARPTVVERADADLLLLAVRLDQTLLTEALISYASGDDVIVPLGALSALLSLAIDVDPERGRAEGFIVREGRRFSLDVGARRVRVDDRETPVDVQRVELHAGDIFVEAGLLSEWLPLDFEIDRYAATLTVRPREPLPMQLRLERERQVQKTLAALGAENEVYPHLENPYALWDSPALDQTLVVSSGSDPSGGRATEARLSTFASADLFRMETSFYVLVNPLPTIVTRGDSSETAASPITDYRVSVGRKDPNATLLGPLHARHVGLFEIYHPGLDLIARPSSGPGVVVSNFPLNRPAQFDRHSFRGDLPPDWEVELYRNDALIAYQQPGPQGTYAFADMPLLFGLNVFRLVFYGPQGQRREETKAFNIGESLTPPGEVYYRLSGNDPKEAAARASVEFDVGLTQHLSASMSLASVGLADGEQHYGRLGSQLFWRRLFATADVAMDRDQGSAWQVNLQTRLGSLGLHLQHAGVNGLTSEVFPALIRSRSAVVVDATARPGPLPPASLALEARRDELEAGRTLEHVVNRVSTSWFGLSFANRARWTLDRQPGIALKSNAEGTFLARKSWRRVGARSELNYGLHPVRNLTTLAVFVEGRLSSQLGFGAGIERRPDARQSRWLLSMNKNQGAYAFGVTSSYSQHEGFGTSLTLSIGLSREPRSGTWHTQASSAALSGAASARVFLDTNANGVMDAGEEPIPGVEFSINQGGHPGETGENGVAFLTNMPSYEEIELKLSRGTLEDPLWLPAVEGVRFVPRAGKVAAIDFPVQVSGEVMGTVYRNEAGAKHEAAGIELELVDPKHGTVVKRTASAYDGFYYISEVPPGRYSLRVVPPGTSHLAVAGGKPTGTPSEDTSSLPLAWIAVSRDLDIAPSGAILDGIDFVLSRPGAPARRR